MDSNEEEKLHIEDIEDKGPIEEVLDDGQSIVMRNDGLVHSEATRQGKTLISQFYHPETGEMVAQVQSYPDGASAIDLPTLDRGFWTLTVDGEQKPLTWLEGKDDVSLKIHPEERAIHITTKD